MKKTTLLLLLSSLFLFLGGCSNNTNNEQQSDNSSSSSVSSSTKENSASSQSSSSRTLNSDDEMSLLDSSWKFDKFTVHQVEAELDDGQLEVKVSWEPKSEKKAPFANFAQVKVTQAGTTLNSVERDDDIDEGEQVRDLDLTYDYKNRTDQIKIQITESDGKSRTVRVNLQ
ncbi:hypothetical protein SIN07_01455 [Pediococcus inopinatus]|uniref:Lipoprotein n=1 Tax=Pediococcus inopinatus TaxID=114090 RepID=A0ABZ0Q3E8_9LACO|nr:hypothetical protein [Pediococcus inopinatus]AVL00605.1 hypothetical protein PI20285_08130 [Pediococcus inopinatus]KRN60866.1 hypothetical protein IV83_GL001272 [Pediococcus inopinatus]WPC17076.1 hypothetical protein N6G94_07785 [Pediococcus inopinatus]WPC19803.1 hypothetical protein N6G95_00980 [Pediococcus inopinatus]WPC21503.1 hypothetical protein N6G96_09585 [Pediococcus inopinatus]